MKKLILGILYWVISLTWGLPMTLVGLLTSLIVIIFFKGKPYKNGYSFIVEVGGNWGGISLGAVALCGKYSNNKWEKGFFEYLRRHEFGHSVQNLIFGPFMLFIVGIPSFIRSKYFNKMIAKGSRAKLKPYDSIWFEYTASAWGHKWVNYIEDTEINWVPYKY